MGAQPFAILTTRTQILFDRKPYQTCSTLAMLLASMITKKELPAALGTLPEEMRPIFQHCWVFEEKERADVAICQLDMRGIVRSWVNHHPRFRAADHENPSTRWLIIQRHPDHQLQHRSEALMTRSCVFRWTSGRATGIEQ